MSEQRIRQVGLDRIVRLRWLERAAELAMAGNPAPEVKRILRDELKGAFRSRNEKVRGSLDKTITILVKTWVRVPRELIGFRDDGLRLLRELPRADRMVVHWGMIMAAYPFWGAVASHAGRLLRLQTTVTAGQVQRRLREQYGERETVSRRVRYVLRSFIDWGVLRETEIKGLYKSGTARNVDGVRLLAWLVEGYLLGQPDGPKALGSVLASTSFFPFRLCVVSADQVVLASERLEVMRHGLDEDLVMLRRR